MVGGRSFEISRQGRHGEARFSELCQDPSASVDAVVNKAANDEHGWDHVIDLTPPQTSGLPADLRDHLIQCFAQIKTTRAEKPTTRVKLSNAIKAAKSPNPTFVFLFHHSIKGRAPILYGRHIWKEEIERILKRAREISIESTERALHRVNFSVAFSAMDRIEQHPSDWMLEVIHENGAVSYSKEKLRLVDTVGYSDFTYSGKFTIPSSASREEIVLHELGLLEDLPVTDFQLFDNRFGLEAAIPERAFDEGRVSLTSEGKPITLKLFAEDNRTFEVSGVCRAPQLIAPDSPEFRLRFDAGCIEILASPKTQNQRINFSLDLDEFGPFDQKTGLMCALAWGRERIRFELHMDQGKLFSGEMRQVPSAEGWMHQHAAVGVHLSDLIGAEKTATIQISHSSFQRCVRDMHFASTLVGAGSLRFEAEFEGDIDPFGHLIGYACTSIDNWCVGAIYQIEHKKRESVGHRQIFYLGNTKVARKFIFKQPYEEFQQNVALEFADFRSQFNGTTAVMMNGDISEWSKAIHARGLLSIDIN